MQCAPHPPALGPGQEMSKLTDRRSVATGSIADGAKVSPEPGKVKKARAKVGKDKKDGAADTPDKAAKKASLKALRAEVRALGTGYICWVLRLDLTLRFSRNGMVVGCFMVEGCAVKQSTCATEFWGGVV